MFDVLVIGGGNAALCAALVAREAGASVLLLEAAPKEQLKAQEVFPAVRNKSHRGHRLDCRRARRLLCHFGVLNAPETAVNVHWCCVQQTFWLGSRLRP